MDVAADALQDRRFLLLSKLGRGGMASVYRAFDRHEQRIVALKVVSAAEPVGPAHPIAAEFEAWSGLSHPNIVRAFELGIARSGPLPCGSPYLVLEHVGGGPAHRVFAPGRLRPALIEELTIQILHALTHIHAAGLVHRDIKPGNVLVDTSPGRGHRVKLTDFGLASPAGAAEAPGTISGSLHYVAPETFLGQAVDARVDLYGLGILLYQLATGELPASGNSVEAVMRWHLAGPPADPCRLRPRFPGRLSRFIRRLTTRRRDERPADAWGALELLGAASPEKRRSRRLIVDRAARARLRLALDAARLGSRRRLTLPRCSRQRTQLLREVRCWSQVRGLDFHELTVSADSGEAGLAQLILRLLLDRGQDAPRLARRFGLDRVLPLELVRDTPVWDHAKDVERGISRCRDGVRLAANRISRFALHCSTQRTLVLSVERAVMRNPLVRSTIESLSNEIDADTRPDPDRCGLLLLESVNRRAISSFATRRDS
jgi:serine/threonine protein kinase